MTKQPETLENPDLEKARSEMSKLVSDALQREVPLFSDHELERRREQFSRMRSDFCAWCAYHQFFNTLALLSTCELRMNHTLPAPAAIRISPKRLEISIHPTVINLWEEGGESRHAAFFLFCHELRHIVQVSDMSAIEDLIDLEPIRDVFVDKKTEASTQEHKDNWQKAIDEIDKKESRQWRQRRFQVANLTMDAALHQDVLKLFPNISHSLNNFLAEEFTPYQSGFRLETVAKDMITSGSAEQFVENFKMKSGPKQCQKIEDALQANGDVLDEVVLEKILRLQYGIVTTESLRDLFESVQGFEHHLEQDRNHEWLQIADEYVRWLAMQIDENQDADSSPQPSDCEGGSSLDSLLEELMEEAGNIDEHGFGDAEMSQEQRQELERKARDAVRRAQEESAVMAHNAGKRAGDEEMMGDASTQLNQKIKAALEALRIKFIKLFKESNNKRYTFQRINRMFSEVDYIPGHRKELKPNPQVVLVLDTSGSMWSKHYINQMTAMARLLYNQEKLCALYFCDTQLHKYNFNDTNKNVKVNGGGGTELSPEICEDIQARENLKNGFELVYATDECCLNLEAAKADERWKVHVINVPKMLGEE